MGISIWQIIIILLTILPFIFTIYYLGCILSRTGISPLWMILLLVPIVQLFVFPVLLRSVNKRLSKLIVSPSAFE